MEYKIYVRRLPAKEWDNRENINNITEEDGKLYAVLENYDELEELYERCKKRAEVIHVNIFIVPFGKLGVMITFYSHILELDDILYDPFTFDKNTVHHKPNKPEILDIVKLKDGTRFLIATHTIGNFIELAGIEDIDRFRKQNIFSQPNFTLRNVKRQRDADFINKMVSLLNREGMIVSIGISDFEFKSTELIFSYVILLYTDKSYDDAFETFKRYAIQVEEEYV